MSATGKNRRPSRVPPAPPPISSNESSSLPVPPQKQSNFKKGHEATNKASTRGRGSLFKQTASSRKKMTTRAVANENAQQQRSHSLKTHESVQRREAPKRISMRPRRSSKMDQRPEWDHKFVEGNTLNRDQDNAEEAFVKMEYETKLRDTPSTANTRNEKKKSAPRQTSLKDMLSTQTLPSRRTSSMSDAILATRTLQRRTTNPDNPVKIRPTTGKVLKTLGNTILHNQRWINTKPVKSLTSASNTIENGTATHRTAFQQKGTATTVENLIQKRIRKRNSARNSS